MITRRVRKPSGCCWLVYFVVLSVASLVHDNFFACARATQIFVTPTATTIQGQCLLHSACMEVQLLNESDVWSSRYGRHANSCLNMVSSCILTEPMSVLSPQSQALPSGHVFPPVLRPSFRKILKRAGVRNHYNKQGGDFDNDHLCVNVYCLWYKLIGRDVIVMTK